MSFSRLALWAIYKPIRRRKNKMAKVFYYDIMTEGATGTGWIGAIIDCDAPGYLGKWGNLAEVEVTITGVATVQVQSSPDNVDWSNVVATYTETVGPHACDAIPQGHRYIRAYCTSYTSGLMNVYIKHCHRRAGDPQIQALGWKEGDSPTPTADSPGVVAVA
jgi:hypothetical protein